MNYAKLVVSILYRFYSRSKRFQDIAYQFTILVLLTLFWINVLTVLPKSMVAFPMLMQSRTSQKLLIGLMYYLPGYFLFRMWIPEKVLKSAQYDESEIRTGIIMLFVYIFVSTAALIVSANWARF
jgi:hypothetical protein